MEVTVFNADTVRNEIVERFKDKTLTKQQVYEALVGKYDHPREVAAIIRKIPSPLALAKYGIWNWILLASLLATLACYFILTDTRPWMMLVYYSFLIFWTLTKNTRFYTWTAALSSFSLLILMIAVFSDPKNEPNWISLSIIILLILTSCFLSVWLIKKLTPEPEVKRIDFITPLRKKESRLIFVFKD